MQQNIQYDPAVIHKLAKRQYRRSVFVQGFYPVIGALGFGFFIYESGGSKLAIIIGAAAGVFPGYLFGTLRSMRLKVQAQTTLCLERIEENTRHTTQPAASKDSLIDRP